MTDYWIVSSKFKRDKSTEDWIPCHTIDAFLENKEFSPYQKREDFKIGDKCILRAFSERVLIADFKIISKPKMNEYKRIYYDIDIDEWDFFVDIDTLPEKYKKIVLRRGGSIDIKEDEYHKLIGIKDFNQNLKINYKNTLIVKLKEKNLEDFLDSFENPLKRSLRYTILYRQKEISKNNIIDLICKDEIGDLVVIELKKKSSNETIGQLATYLAFVRENMAKTTQNVKGLILALDIDEQLIKGAREVGFEVKLYQIKII